MTTTDTTMTTTEESDDLELVTTEELLDRSLPRPVANEELSKKLRLVLEEGLADLEGRRKPLRISKARLAEAEGCEAFAEARREERFSWSESAALGSLVDKAITIGLAKRSSAEACVEEAISEIRREGKDLDGGHAKVLSGGH